VYHDGNARAIAKVYIYIGESLWHSSVL
ncbi:hypothetical protein ACN38_g6200, partial [Penicillium nordicum]